MEEAEVLELYELHYSDLRLLSSSPNDVSLASPEEVERLGSIRRAIMETLGPTGPGLLSITGVPNASLLRRNLLTLARKISLLDHDQRKRIIEEHSLGSDVPLKNPNRNVSSFAMQLKYEQALEFSLGEEDCDNCSNLNSEPDDWDAGKVGEFQDDEFKKLSHTFKELGYCMMGLGLCLAQICDKAIGGQELEQSLLESGTAKGRLIHYHSVLDNHFIKETGRKKGSNRKQDNSKKDNGNSLNIKQTQLEVTNGHDGSHAKGSNLWQQWHYDYGIFTVLTAPMFMAPFCVTTDMLRDQYLGLCDQECPYPNGNSYLQIFYPNKNKVYMVRTCPDSFIIQVGESADILSKGKLRSTLHCVCKPSKLENLCRETFVVFLQPAWSKTLSISDGRMEHYSYLSNEANGDAKSDLNEFTQEIHKIVPPLSSRLKDGMTFAEFSRETTKQYYGGSGLQANR